MKDVSKVCLIRKSNHLPKSSVYKIISNNDQYSIYTIIQTTN